MRCWADSVIEVSVISGDLRIISPEGSKVWLFIHWSVSLTHQMWSKTVRLPLAPAFRP